MSPEVAQALAGFAALGQEALAAGFLVFLRVGAAMAVLPVFGEQMIPMRIRLGLTLAFTLIVAPAVLPGILAMLDGGTPGALMILTEVLAGLSLGLALRLFVMALQIAGTMAAQATSLAQFFGGAGADPQPAMAQLLLIAGLALAVAAGLHVRAAEALILSYDLLPAGQLPSPAVMAEWGTAQVARAFTLAFTLAAPFVIAALIYNVALGVINKAMPQLMVVLVGAPALTLGGLALLMIVAVPLLGVWMMAFDRFLTNPFTAP
jgi:flagellar biosynthetic protein FliR